MITLGNASKYGPIHINTTIKTKQETIEANCVLPPTVNWMEDLESEAENGMQEKNEPTILPAPYG